MRRKIAQLLTGLAVISVSLYIATAPLAAVELPFEPIQPVPQTLGADPQKAALGKLLFFDSRLSADNSISCAHCHNLDKYGGADPFKHSFGVEGREGLINSPTVFNSGLNFTQFWDGRSKSLEDQVDGPVQVHAEMASTWPQLLAKLAADSTFSSLFSRSYDTGLTQTNIKHAIAEYERTLLTPNSRFDRYLNGDQTAISADEKMGYSKFKEYGCTACHQGRNVGGNLFQVLGVMGDYFSDKQIENEADYGRFNVTGKEEDKFYFKVPSLRLVVLTAPYFHNGSYESLAEAIRTMAKYQLGREIPDEDIRSIIRFLYTLPGEYEGKSLEPSEKKYLTFASHTEGSAR